MLSGQRRLSFAYPHDWLQAMQNTSVIVIRLDCEDGATIITCLQEWKTKVIGLSNTFPFSSALPATKP